MNELIDNIFSLMKRWGQSILEKIGYYCISEYVARIGWLKLLLNFTLSVSLGEFIYNFFFIMYVNVYYFGGEKFQTILEDYNTLQFFAITRVFLFIFYFFIVWYRFFVSNRIQGEYYCLKESEFIKKLLKSSFTDESKPNLITDYQIGESDFPYIFQDTKYNEWQIEKNAFNFLVFGPIYFFILSFAHLSIFSEYEGKSETFFIVVPVFIIIFLIFSRIGWKIFNKFFISPNLDQRNWKSFWIDLSFLILFVSQDQFIIPSRLEIPKLFEKDIEKRKESMKNHHPDFSVLNANEKEELKSYHIFLMSKNSIKMIKHFLEENKNKTFKQFIQAKVKQVERQIDNQPFNNIKELVDISNEVENLCRIIITSIKFPKLIDSFLPLINIQQNEKEELSKLAIEIHKEIKNEPTWIFPKSLASLLTKAPVISAIGGFFALFFAELIVTLIPPILFEIYVFFSRIFS